MRKFAQAVLPALPIVALLVIGNPGSLWAGTASVPEINPSSTGIAALGLIAGAVLLIRGRRKK